MRRVAFKMYLNEGQKEEYKRRHSELWPELKRLLKEAGMYDYSIFLDEETNVLFAYHKVRGNEGALDLGNREIVQKWWKYMAEIMEAHPDYTPVTVGLEELFYME